MDHICEEVSSLHLKLEDMESSIIHQVSAELKSSLPALVTTTLQEQLLGLLSASLKDCLPSIIQESLQTPIPASSEQFSEKQTKLNKKVVKHLNRQFNIFHVAQSDRFAYLQKSLQENLSSALKSDMGKSVTSKSMQTQLNDIQNILELAVIVDDTAEGEKNKKAKDAYPAATQGEHQSAELLVETQGEQLADLKVANEESAPPASDDKINEGKELVVHNSEEKKSEGIISVDDDSDEDDKQPL
ncbi:hypothetical protein Tco_0671503 [Tanacetum coccineum]